MPGDHDEIYRRISKLEVAIGEVCTELRAMHGDVQDLLRVVVRGNGDSLVSRIRVLEARTADQRAVTSEDRRGLWAVRAALVAAAAAVLTSLIGLVAR